ncbi:hypothetical protein HY024_00050 [Candidatus Curtissbacteria bacterium]|nr:hypothetical protein [Candidatus Curtissbacteria bacterium]
MTDRADFTANTREGRADARAHAAIYGMDLVADPTDRVIAEIARKSALNADVTAASDTISQGLPAVSPEIRLANSFKVSGGSEQVK